ncbi:hypothetical protein WMY93_000273 [Mugilogobius chulae]|uniref:Uncharacterized protein n=1 Tax=Mugilogobius chulae TaxID=88201 RepID=A0AAW0Q9K4_9GOBI
MPNLGVKGDQSIRRRVTTTTTTLDDVTHQLSDPDVNSLSQTNPTDPHRRTVVRQITVQMDPKEKVALKKTIRELRSGMWHLRKDLEKKELKIADLTFKLEEKDELLANKAAIEKENRQLKAQLAQREACYATIAQEKAHSAKVEQQLETFKTKFLKVKDWYNDERNRNQQQQRDMKELEKTHKDELTKINRNMSSLKEEMTTLEKKNKSLQQNGVDVIDLKQKLAERDKQLKEEISKPMIWNVI